MLPQLSAAIVYIYMYLILVFNFKFAVLAVAALDAAGEVHVAAAVGSNHICIYVFNFSF